MLSNKSKDILSTKSQSNKTGLTLGMYAPVLISSVLFAWAFMYVNLVLAYAAVSILLFSLLQSTTSKKIFCSGFFFGFASSLLINYWMLSVVTNYAKGNLLLSLVCYIGNAVVFALCFGLQLYLYGRFKLMENRRSAFIINALMFSFIWVLFEWLRASLFNAMPWLSFSLGITTARSLCLIQPASLGNVFLLSVLIVLPAWLVAYSILKRNLKMLFLPAAIFIVHFITGWLLFKDISKQIKTGNNKKITVALVLAGLSPEIVWNNNSADALVSHLLTLNNNAVEKKPDLIIWSETVVPWTYAPDDDFLKEVIKKTSESNCLTLIGMNSASDPSSEILNNSIYFLSSQGKQLGRYDKQDLLTLVEKPLFNPKGKFILPFLSSSGLKMQTGSYDKPIETPWGKAGIMICNESTNSFLAADLVKKGAGFFINQGNDNWFWETYVPLQHFYNDRLRAVENRRDIIININRGFCGVIKATGEITSQINGKTPGVSFVELNIDKF